MHGERDPQWKILDLMQPRSPGLGKKGNEEEVVEDEYETNYKEYTPN